MADQEVKFSNFYESTLANGGGGLPTNVIVATLTAAPTSNGTSAISAPYFLVVDPDSATKREVIEVTASTGTSLTTIVRDKKEDMVLQEMLLLHLITLKELLFVWQLSKKCLKMYTIE